MERVTRTDARVICLRTHPHCRRPRAGPQAHRQPRSCGMPFDGDAAACWALLTIPDQPASPNAGGSDDDGEDDYDDEEVVDMAHPAAELFRTPYDANAVVRRDRRSAACRAMSIAPRPFERAGSSGDVASRRRRRRDHRHGRRHAAGQRREHVLDAPRRVANPACAPSRRSIPSASPARSPARSSTSIRPASSIARRSGATTATRSSRSSRRARRWTRPACPSSWRATWPIARARSSAPAWAARARSSSRSRSTPRAAPTASRPFFIPMGIANMASGPDGHRVRRAGPQLRHGQRLRHGRPRHRRGDRDDPPRRRRHDALPAGPRRRSTRRSSAPLPRCARCRRATTIPQGASRPFDEGRDGFVIAEGAARARARGAGPRTPTRRPDPGRAVRLRRDRGREAHHAARAGRRGRRPRRADEPSPRPACDPTDIDHVSAHATSHAGRRPGRARRRSRRSSATTRQDVSITATKGAIGHTLGAAGGIGAVATIRAMRDGCVPPTLNLVDPVAEPMGDLDCTPLTVAVARHPRRRSSMPSASAARTRPLIFAAGMSHDAADKPTASDAPDAGRADRPSRAAARTSRSCPSSRSKPAAPASSCASPSRLRRQRRPAGSGPARRPRRSRQPARDSRRGRRSPREPIRARHTRRGAADRAVLLVALARRGSRTSRVGGPVSVGQVIGLIEAMKLFNEIKSDRAGRVVADPRRGWRAGQGKAATDRGRGR